MSVTVTNTPKQRVYYIMLNKFHCRQRLLTFYVQKHVLPASLDHVCSETGI